MILDYDHSAEKHEDDFQNESPHEPPLENVYGDRMVAVLLIMIAVFVCSMYFLL